MLIAEEDILKAMPGATLDALIASYFPEVLPPDAEPSGNTDDALLLLESLPGEKRIHIFPPGDWRAPEGKCYTVIVGGRDSYGASGEFYGVEARAETLALAVCIATLLLKIQE